MALFFAPKSQFFGADCGRGQFDGGIIPFTTIHSLFCQHQQTLVPNGTEQETKIILSFFSKLGICRLLPVSRLNPSSPPRGDVPRAGTKKASFLLPHAR